METKCQRGPAGGRCLKQEASMVASQCADLGQVLKVVELS